MSELSIRDELTHVYNHRYFQERLAEEFQRSGRYQYPLACLILDLDFFKMVNEKHGHKYGDYILIEMADLLRNSLRSSDILARFGGEEFVFLFPETNTQDARNIADRIRKETAGFVFQKETANGSRLTVSGGIACYPDDRITRKDQLVEFAHRALYKAKTSGRDRIWCYGQIVQDFEKDMPRIKINEEKLSEVESLIYGLSEKVKRAYVEATRALVFALEAKDPCTKEHSQQVGKYSYLIAKMMGLPRDQVTIIEHAGLLHDIGKLCISDDILFKPSKLRQEEYDLMKEHTLLGYKILQPIKYLHDELPIILYHHEWYNGQGYPHGLKGNEIPLGARIVCVADSYVTMMDTSRLYHKVRTKEESVKEMIFYSGIQFDPKVVKALIDVLVFYKEIPPESYDPKSIEEVIEKDRA